MALPKLLQKLFANDGVGPLLRSDIMPIKTVDGYAPDANGNVGTQRLPLSGGTITGKIQCIATGDAAIASTNNSTQLRLSGGTEGWGSGAVLALSGADREGYNGTFALSAISSESQSESLIGTADGSLTWRMREVERVYSSAANYIRYESGLQICWGRADTATSGSTVSVTLPAAFADTMYKIAIARNGNNTSQGSVLVKGTITATGFNVYFSLATGAMWIAIGKWK